MIKIFEFSMVYRCIYMYKKCSKMQKGTKKVYKGKKALESLSKYIIQINRQRNISAI